jgi:hypothetical protein
VVTIPSEPFVIPYKEADVPVDNKKAPFCKSNELIAVVSFQSPAASTAKAELALFSVTESMLKLFADELA